MNTNIYTGLFHGDVTVAIANLMSEENIEILASPQITTMDHIEAEVFMGEEKNVRTVDNQGVAAFQQQEAGISLTVTPHITQDNRIRLELKPENNSFTVDAAGQIAIQRQEAETQVVVNDGETVVIAGLTSNQETTAEAGIPFLKDIPVLGFLFRSTRTEVVKKDLIIFVTPHVVNTIKK
jgi:type II secretory pathway component GspD/PulD (secretin)